MFRTIKIGYFFIKYLSYWLSAEIIIEKTIENINAQLDGLKTKLLLLNKERTIAEKELLELENELINFTGHPAKKLNLTRKKNELFKKVEKLIHQTAKLKMDLITETDKYSNLFSINFSETKV